MTAAPAVSTPDPEAGSPPEADRLLLGPDSHVGRAWSEWAFAVPFAGRVLALQGTHPVVSAGLEQHSSVFKDPGDEHGTRSVTDSP